MHQESLDLKRPEKRKWKVITYLKIALVIQTS